MKMMKGNDDTLKRQNNFMGPSGWTTSFLLPRQTTQLRGGKQLGKGQHESIKADVSLFHY